VLMSVLKTIAMMSLGLSVNVVWLLLTWALS
jgi:hypothetical protein